MSAVTLEGIDQVRERTSASYHACYEALSATGGDVVEAILRLEESHAPMWVGRARGACSRAVGAMGRVANEAAAARITVRHGDRAVAEVPVLLAALGAALLPGLAAAGLIAAIATRSSVTVAAAEGADAYTGPAEGAPQRA